MPFPGSERRQVAMFRLELPRLTSCTSFTCTEQLQLLVSCTRAEKLCFFQQLHKCSLLCAAFVNEFICVCKTKPSVIGWYLGNSCQKGAKAASFLQQGYSQGDQSPNKYTDMYTHVETRTHAHKQTHTHTQTHRHPRAWVAANTCQ